ncbi:MAG: immunoglobulin domain-containing protein [Opitutaceae bacterium]|nr:immunoglobulin domain-containing protein [Opitutaceae bacterium]
MRTPLLGAVWMLVFALGFTSSPAQPAFWTHDNTFALAIRSDVAALQPDGKIVAALPTEIVRLGLDGMRDSSFASPLGANERVSQLVYQTGGRILASGLFLSDGNLRSSSIRLDATGRRDATFSYVRQFSNSLHMLRGSEGGFFDGNQRFLANGQPDDSFRAARLATEWLVAAPLADGSLLVAPRMSPGGREPRLIRLLRDGSTDVDFIPDVRHFPFRDIVAIVPLADGRAFICGREGPPDEPGGIFVPSHLRLLRMKPTGEVDFAHYAPLPYDGQEEFVVAGVLLDLLREAGAPDVVTIDQPLFRNRAASEIYRLRLALSSAGRLHFGTSAVYVRASGGGASFDPKPVMAAQSATSTFNLALGFPGQQLSAQPGGLFPLSYEWRLNGAPISGATATVFRLPSVTAASAGDYTLAATNAHGAVVSNPMRVNVDSNRRSVTIVQPPSSHAVRAGDTAVLSVEASGSPSPIYQWSLHSVPIPGANDAILRIPNAQPTHTGSYSVMVSVFGSGATTTGPAALMVLNPLTGVWMGTLGSNGTAGDIALVTKADRSLVLLSRLHATGSILVAKADRVEADGSFNATGLESSSQGSVARTASGTVSPVAGATGQITAPSLPFSAAIVPSQNPASPFGGYYHLRAVLAGSAEAHVVAAGAGRVFAVLRGRGSTDSGEGTVDTAGRFTVPLSSGPVLAGSFGVDGSVSASVDRGVFAGQVFAGLRDDLPRTDRLVNLATRAWAGTGEEALIAGFVSTGPSREGLLGTRTVLMRAIGPSLAGFGIANALGDPLFRVNSIVDGLVSGGNGSDDWCLESGAASVAVTAQNRGAFPLRNSRDAAANVSVGAGNYSVTVEPANGPPGIALVEIYDGTIGEYTPTSPRLLNLSTRGRVDPGEGALFAGFVVTGNAPKRLLVRGIGPALGNFGVGGVLADPVVTLFRDGAVVLENDDWDSSASTSQEIAEAAVSVGAFALPGGSRDACLLITVPPGAYSARVAGKSNGRGIALVEIYEVPW